jgi:hypothetical protein
MEPQKSQSNIDQKYKAYVLPYLAPKYFVKVYGNQHSMVFA